MSSLSLCHSRAQGNRFWQTLPPPALCFPARSPGRCYPYARWSYASFMGLFRSPLEEAGKCTRVNASKPEKRTLSERRNFFRNPSSVLTLIDSAEVTSISSSSDGYNFLQNYDIIDLQNHRRGDFV